MPRLHTSWSKLKEKLRISDHYPVDKRIGKEKTLVFLIEDLRYDPDIPILEDKQGVLIPIPSATKPRAEPAQNNVDPATPPQAYAVMKSGIDQLVLKELDDDEFDKYREDDLDEESEISRNLKKIRSDPVSKPVPNPKPASIPKPAKNHREVPKQKSNEPPKPDWEATKKHVQANQFNIVLKDFQLFEDSIKSDILARQTLKEAIIKCILEDETFSLIELLQIAFRLDYEGESEFWSELIQRLKRKLKTHTDVPKYKGEQNSAWVYQNYEIIKRKIFDYVKTNNVMLTLRFDMMDFLFENKPECKPECKPEPLQNFDVNISLPDVKPKIEEERKVEAVKKSGRVSYNVFTSFKGRISSRKPKL